MPTQTSPKKQKKLFEVNPELYHRFRSELKGILANDSTFKATYLDAVFESKLLDSTHSAAPGVRRQRAIEKWLASEALNADTNMRLMFAGPEDIIFQNERSLEYIHADMIIETAKRFLRKLLGDRVPWDELRGSFSGGAATSIKRGAGTIAKKYQQGQDITEAAIWPFLQLTKSAVWAPRDFNLIEGNVLFTVPKTSDIDRCAAKEPDYNMYAQKAVGDAIRRRLKRVGVDLDDQTKNRRLAKEGAESGQLATVDLSSASDSVTVQLVMRLVPEEWFLLMDDLRSHKTWIDDHWHQNQMFSSMGNAFTFELESALFWALTRAAAYHSNMKGAISVYGDDIICPSGLKVALTETLRFFGFRLNESKSFFEGPFRESCGKHYHGRVDVTPFYVREIPRNVSDWCHLLNSLRKWCKFSLVTGILDPEYYDLWRRYAEEIIPAPLWGGDDWDRRDYLVSPGRSPAAVLRPKQLQRSRTAEKLMLGAYLHWLDAADKSKERAICTILYDLTGKPVWILQPGELVTTKMVDDGPLEWRRVPRVFNRHYHRFPQELGE